MPSKETPIFYLSLLIMTIAHTVIHVFVRIHTTLFPVLREEFNLSLHQMGIIASIPLLCQALAYVPSGMLADKFGHRTIIALSFLMAGAASLAVSRSYNASMLIASLSALILTSTLYHPAAYSLTSELLPKEHRAKALGVHGAGGTLGMALGPLSVSLLIGSFEWRSIYIFWALPILLSILAILKLKPSGNGQRLRSQETSGTKMDEAYPRASVRSVLTIGFLSFMSVMGLRMFQYEIIGTFLPTYLHDDKGLSIAQASLIYGLMSLMGVFAAPIGGYFADKIGDKRWLMIAISGNALSIFCASLSPSIILLSTLCMCYGFFNFSSMGAATSLIAKFTPRSLRGTGYALYFLPGSLMGAVAPIIGAYVAELLGLWSVFPLSVVSLLLGLILLRIGV